MAPAAITSDQIYDELGLVIRYGFRRPSRLAARLNELLGLRLFEEADSGLAKVYALEKLVVDIVAALADEPAADSSPHEERLQAFLPDVLRTLFDLDPHRQPSAVGARRRRIVEGYLHWMTAETFRTGEERRLRRLVAETIHRREAAQSAKSTRGTTEQPASREAADESEARTLLTAQVLEPLALPVAGLFVTLSYYLAWLPRLRDWEPSEPEPVSDEEIEAAKEFYGEGSVGADMIEFGPAAAALQQAQLVAAWHGHAWQSLWAYAMVHTQTLELYHELDGWEGPARNVARNAQYLLEEIKRKAPIRSPETESRLRHVVRMSQERVGFLDFVQTDTGAPILEAWTAWLQRCRCDPPSSDPDEPHEPDIRACEPHALQDACVKMLKDVFDLEALSPKIYAQVDDVLTPVSGLDYILSWFKMDGPGWWENLENGE